MAYSAAFVLKKRFRLQKDVTDWMPSFIIERWEEMPQMKHTKIVATIGPASDDPAILEQLVEAGANVFRLNFSHGNHQEHGLRIDRIHALRSRLHKPIGIMLDTKGPEIRVGTFPNGPVTLSRGQAFLLTSREVLGNDKQANITYDGLHEDVSVGTRILLDDGLIALVVEGIDGLDILCRVLNGGQLSDRKGVNVPGVDVRLPSITDKDIDDILFGIEKGIDFIAASFVRKSADILAIRRLLHENNGDGIQIISKIESRQAVNNIEEIVKVSDGVMVARGDLGVELPMQEVPVIQKELIRQCRALGRPVIIATQMMDSMIRNPRPTRAEVNDVANAVYDQCDCVMLSGESASGAYPVLAVQTMATICQTIEDSITDKALEGGEHGDSVADAVSFACCQCAQNIRAKAIVSVTSSGSTARMIAKNRPASTIVATTQHERVFHQLSLVWGVNPLISSRVMSTDDLMEGAVNTAQRAGYIADGDVVVITGGVPVGVSGSTNILKVHVVGDVMARGMAMGHGTIRGRVCVAKSVEDCQKYFSQGDILITKETDHDYLPFMRLASALVCEDDRPNCHTAVVGVALGLPLIIGVKGITDIAKNGSVITVDAERGLVINAQA
jgi:pyruvate kinase